MQHSRIGMPRRRENSVGRSAFHNLAAPHDVGAVGKPANDAEIVRDEHDRHAEPFLEIGKEFEDLGLHRHVERRRRLVGDQHVRIVGERHRDHHPLALASGHLMRDRNRTARRARECATSSSSSIARALALCLAHPPCARERQSDLVADPVERIKGRHRLLKNHRQLRAAIIVQLVGRQADDFVAAILHRALRPAIGGEEAHHRHHGLAFAGTGFAHDSDGFASCHVEVDALDGVENTIAGAEADVEVADCENGLGHVSDPSDRERPATRRR